MYSPWLDDLSEDWVPQPRSSSPSEAGSVVSSASHDSVQIKPPPRSRIPRLRSSPGPTNVTAPRNDNFSRPLPGKRKTALAERSQSENNIQHNTSAEFHFANDPRSLRNERSVSASSSESVVHYGTVEQKAPSFQAKKPHDTPEWKRRLIQGKMGYGEQRDLFSPMGLENIFQKPSTQRSPGSKKKSRLPLFKDLSMMPSSPPPWPMRDAHAKDSVMEDQEQESESDTALDSVAEEPSAEESAEDSFEEYEEESDAGSVVHHNPETDEELERGLQTRSDRTGDNEQPRLGPIHGREEERSRMVSGQTALSDASFSPVFISKHNTTDGGVDYQALDLSRSQLERLKSQIGEKDEFRRSDISDTSSFAKLRSETLPEDLPTGTPEQPTVGQYVNLKRGGFSNDGSFMHRPLSPSPLGRKLSSPNVDDPNPATRREEAVPSVPPVYRPPSRFRNLEVITRPMSPPISPKTPAHRQNSSFLSPDKPAWSGGQLKLFGDHDTFTAAKLQRRMSQMEDTLQLQEYTQDSKRSSGGSSPSKRNFPTTPRLPSVEEASIQKNTSAVEDDLGDDILPEIHEPMRESIGSYFGGGALNEHPFPDDKFSLPSSRNSQGRSLNPSRSSSETSQKEEPPKFRFSINDLASESTTRTKRKLSRQSVKSWTTTVSNKNSISIPKSPRPSNKIGITPKRVVVPDLLDVTEISDGKRPPTSPFKNPTPKRRRTLRTDDLAAYKEFAEEPVKAPQPVMQSAPNKRRTPIRQENLKHIADPAILARRTILRPRNPTPSQRRREQIQADILDATDAFLSSSPRLHAIQEHLESPSRDFSIDTENERAIAGEIAAFSIKLNMGMRDEERKRSVTTQDFLDEARLIMDHIRAKGRPNSALESLIESSSESPTQYRFEGLGIQPSFSRPPSRSDGSRSGWRNPMAQAHDKRVVSHLRKYREQDEEDFMPPSFRSLKMQQLEDQGNESNELSDGQAENIRIITNKLTHRNLNRRQSNATQSSARGRSAYVDDVHESRPSTMGSSMGRTNMTTVSRRSDNVATLAPEAVAHLIPQEIAGMSFDREKGIWVKKKGSRKGAPGSADASNVTNSEDDPLRGIPDLTIDELEELKRMSQYPPSPPSPEPRGRRLGDDLRFSTGFSNIDGPTISVVAPSDESGDTARPETREGAEPPLADPTSSTTAQSKFSSHFSSSSGRDVETRATSYSDRGSDHTKPRQFLQPETIPEVRSSSPAVEHEYGIFEGRNGSQSSQGARRVGDFAISFSSARNSGNSATETSGEQAMHYPIIEPDMGDLSQFNQHNENFNSSPLRRDLPDPPRSALKSSRSSIKPNRPYGPPRAEESKELSILHNPSDPLRKSIRVSLGPVAQGTTPASPNQYAYADVTFMLSELPDFTVNQVDEREVQNRTLVKRQVGGANTVNTNEDRFGQGTMELVKALQDVQAEEPFWEDLRKVNLKAKGLPTLHRLDEMCYRLEELDISDNHIAQLAGAPSAIRKLNVSGNCLTSLTAWGHLNNLQYLDVSGNQIESLKGFAGLVHLRELKVDNNQVESLDGISELDGLIKLSLKGNRIEEADFEGTELNRLTDLDLSGNGITSVRNLVALPSLERLNLNGNDLVKFPSHTTAMEAMSRVHSLSLCRNRLESANFRDFSSLVSLDLDSNRLSDIAGIENLSHLRSLSARDQQTQKSFNMSAFLANADIHQLHLSSNTIPSFTLPHTFLNLHRLELASCGLQSLPEDFGQLAPNLRYLNLNFNALKDLRPLLNIKKLGTLLLAGNRLARLRRNVLVLAKLGTVTRIDFRDNPFSVGFYPPLWKAESMVSRGRTSYEEDVEEQEPNALPEADQEKDRQYVSRLDEETKMRRRVYEMLLAHSCKELRLLDGLEFNRQETLVKDECWERLLVLGIVKKSSKVKEGKEGESIVVEGEVEAGNE